MTPIKIIIFFLAQQLAYSASQSVSVCRRAWQSPNNIIFT